MGSSGRSAKKRRRNRVLDATKSTSTTACVNEPAERAAVGLLHGRTDEAPNVDRAESPTRRVRLALDIWLMIIDHFPEGSVEEITEIHSRRVFPATFRERRDVLRALSQTTRELRALCLPLLWREVEICTADVPEKRWRHSVAHTLRLHCLGLVKTKGIAAYVKTMTVSLPQCAAHPVLKVFGRCLQALPNLRTLNIVACTFTREDIRDEFKKRKCPSIREMRLPALACPILLACPNVQKVKIIGGSDCAHCMDTITKACGKVESVEGIMARDHTTCQAFSKALTRLSNLVVLWCIETGPAQYEIPQLQPCISSLSSCSNLRKLALYIILMPSPNRHCGYNFRDNHPLIESFLARAKGTLKTLQGPVKKMVCISFRDLRGRQIERSEEVP